MDLFSSSIKPMFIAKRSPFLSNRLYWDSITSETQIHDLVQQFAYIYVRTQIARNVFADQEKFTSIVSHLKYFTQLIDNKYLRL